MITDEVTVLLLTYNESPNIGRILQRLTWAKRIVVIDSYSTDETLEILKSFPQVEIYQRKFDTAANQDNFGLDQISTGWVLSLDADYLLSEELIEEIKNLTPQEPINAYWVRFKYCVFGKVLCGSLYPPRRVLYRREKARYEDDGHTQRVRIDGQTGWLSSYILHDDRKPLSRWLSSQDRYMLSEVEKLRQTPNEQLGKVDLIRRNKVLAPFILLFYCLIIQRGILDGWAGWYYALQRMLAETLLAIRLIEDEQLDSQAPHIVNHPLPTTTQQEHTPN